MYSVLNVFVFSCLMIAVRGETCEEVYKNQTLPVDLLLGGQPSHDDSMNYFIDKQMPKWISFLKRRGFDTRKIPNVNKSFSHKVLFITYHGNLNLTNGHVTNLTAIRRSGDVIVEYLRGIVRVRVEFAFIDLRLHYGYKAKIMGKGPTGHVNASMSDLNIIGDFIADFKTEQILIQEFKLNHFGKLHLDVSTHKHFNWLVNTVSNTFIGLYRKEILHKLEENLRKEMQEHLNNIWTDFNLYLNT